ncbi:MAG: hypothetical protein J7502_15755, partial [Flavisolibacter sp.]|nr:hypothetical protein [Flavisolibacter sp.]
TEAAVIKDGIELGEMNKKLLGKIEELTLYLIEQNKAIKTLYQQNQSQQKEIDLLKTQIKK